MAKRARRTAIRKTTHTIIHTMNAGMMRPTPNPARVFNGQRTMIDFEESKHPEQRQPDRPAARVQGRASPALSLMPLAIFLCCQARVMAGLACTVASTSAAMSSTRQSLSVTPASIAGVTRSVLWMRAEIVEHGEQRDRIGVVFEPSSRSHS